MKRSALQANDVALITARGEAMLRQLATKYYIRKTKALLPWRVITPGGAVFDSPTHAHAIEIVDHLLGFYQAHRRSNQKG